jgi:hypothetical protein
MMRRPQAVLTLVAALALVFAATGEAVARPALPESGMAAKRSVDVDVAGYNKEHGPHSQLECTATGTGPNLNLDCDDPFPNNEPDIEVDPADAHHMIASSNDYGSCCDQFYTTFDGGQTWQTGDMSRENPGKTGSDPVTVFDRKHGVAIHSSLNYSLQHAAGTQACDGDLVVSISSDGGLVWQPPVVVDDGIGCDLSKLQLFNDKEWIVTDNNSASPFFGRTYVTWSKFESHDGSYVSSAIWEAHSDDGGQSWSAPKPISGVNPALCTFQTAGPVGECDENQFSVPTIGPDGGVYVAFENSQNQALWESAGEFDDQYLLVHSTDGGQTWSAPAFVAGLEDGVDDYPINVNGRQTLTGYQLRTNSAGNIVAGPNGTLYLVFSDNRNGTRDVPTPVTNLDVFLMVSADGGTTWSAPMRVDAGAGDQWFPWVEVDPVSGQVGVIYHDRGNANGPLYTTAFAEGAPGALVKTTVSAAPSNPTQSLFFKANATGCEACATFHGDYIAVSYGADGVANLVWTDMSTFVPSSQFGTGYAQFIFYARH